jgi:hypothetical protein
MDVAWIDAPSHLPGRHLRDTRLAFRDPSYECDCQTIFMQADGTVLSWLLRYADSDSGTGPFPRLVISMKLTS